MLNKFAKIFALVFLSGVGAFALREELNIQHDRVAVEVVRAAIEQERNNIDVAWKQAQIRGAISCKGI
jgi:hypothetical protein